jgi:hypothetical protein
MRYFPSRVNRMPLRLNPAYKYSFPFSRNAPSGWDAPASTRLCCQSGGSDADCQLKLLRAAVIDEVVAQSHTSAAYWSCVRRKPLRWHRNG